MKRLAYMPICTGILNSINNIEFAIQFLLFSIDPSRFSIKRSASFELSSDMLGKVGGAAAEHPFSERIRFRTISAKSSASKVSRSLIATITNSEC